MIAVVAAGHDVADARLLLAVVVVVGDENGPETVHARLVLVAEVVGDQFEVRAVEFAAPDGAGLHVGVVAAELAALAVGALQVVDAGIADAEVELLSGPIRMPWTPWSWSKPLKPVSSFVGGPSALPLPFLSVKTRMSGDWQTKTL